MEFIEETCGIYKPIKVLTNTPMYEETLQACWHIGTYKSQIALMVQLLSLQQKEQLPSEVTAEDMIELLVEQNKLSLRVKLWEFDLESIDADTRSLLKLVWEVNTRMKMRNVEFEARNVLNSHKAVPPEFKISRFRKLSETCARNLTQRQQEGPTYKPLSPREAVMEVVPKVLQGFWLPLSSTPFNMPSQLLSTIVVSVTKAVGNQVSSALSNTPHQVAFSRSTRDATVLSIQEKVRQAYPEEVLMKGINRFSPEMLNIITDAATGEICLLFQTATNLLKNANCSAIAPSTSVADPPASTVDLENNLDEAENQVPCSSEPDSVDDSAPPAILMSFDEPLSKTEGRKQRFFQWFKKTFCCCFLPKVTE